ncbi:MAG: hypothetical protein LBT09_06750 [Planctomycetaceae bacterium]|jgi:hypothetical protein|nr:hypothetical protein [Planctomycetaceae bacterium]
MYKNFIEWIDSIGDWMNPVVVRDVRRRHRSGSDFRGIITYSCVMVVGCLLIYFLANLETLQAEIQRIASHKDIFIICNFIIFFTTNLCTSASLILVCSIVICERTDDEMFQITPITPRQYLHAYVLESLFFSIFSSALLIPLAVIIFANTLNFLIVIATFLSAVMFGQIIFLVVLSFIARIKNADQIFYMLIFFCIGGGSFLAMPVVLPWIIVVGVLLEGYFSKTTFDINYGFGFVSIFILLPIALLLLGVIAYYLSLYSLKTRRKSIITGLLFNMFCYSLFSFFAACIYWAIAWIAFTFIV